VQELSEDQLRKLVLFSIQVDVRGAARGIKVALVVLAETAANTRDRERNKMSSTNPKDLLALPELNSEPYRGLNKSWNEVLVEKLRVAQLVKEYLEF